MCNSKFVLQFLLHVARKQNKKIMLFHPVFVVCVCVCVRVTMYRGHPTGLLFWPLWQVQCHGAGTPWPQSGGLV